MHDVYREFNPPTALKSFVECFWTRRGSSGLNCVLPDTCIDIVFSRATGLAIAGTMTKVLDAPDGEFVGVRFRAGMARQFIGVPAIEVVDTVLPLEDAWGRRGRALDEQLRSAAGSEEMVATLCAALKIPSEVSPAQQAIEFLARNAGMISLKEISRYAGLGARQLRRRCLEATGISPKHLARIARFRRACSFIHARSPQSWASLSLECGYYDQAHFIRDFQEFSGSTPGEYVVRRAA